MKIHIVADSTCDLPPEIIKQLNIELVPLFINVGSESYKDGLDLSREEFYSRLAEFPEHPQTGTPGPTAFTDIYKKLENEGAEAIISIHLSESLSATVLVAKQAAEDYQGIPVHVVDSGQLSMGTGFQVELAGQMAQQGNSIEEILPALKDLGSRTFVAAALDTLEFLRRSGRMNGIVTGLGGLLQLKPILTMIEGKPDSVRVRTSAKAKLELKKLLQPFLPFERIAFLHTNSEREVQQFFNSLSSLKAKSNYAPQAITPVIGAHVGPGAIGFAVVKRKNNEQS